MRRSFGALTLAIAVFAGCAGQPPTPIPTVQATASVSASAQAPTDLPSNDADATPIPSDVVGAPPSEATVPATARPKGAATARPTRVPVQTAVPEVTEAPVATEEPAPSEAPVATPEPARTETPVPTPVPFPAGSVSAGGAIGYVGQVATVCGRVVSASYASYANGGPTFLNIDKPYPNSPFTILIWEEHRASFGGAPEQAFLGARVCITGPVSIYSGRAQIESSGGDIDVYD